MKYVEKLLEARVKSAIEAAPTIEDCLELPEVGKLSKRNYVSARSADSFRRLARIMNNVTGICDQNGELDWVINHELQHAVASKCVGVNSLRFTVIFANIADNLNVQCMVVTDPKWDATDLEIVAPLLFPLEPSEGDIADAAEYEYDVDRVGHEATMLNTEHGFFIPVPMSYRSDNRSYFLPPST